MPNPRVSVGLPVFNGGSYLAGALRCLLQQDYQDFELIISDNASTDSTGSICREYAAKDSRIRYYRNEHNIGATPNYNRVFRLARGEFFKWASHDDECHSSLLRRCLETFEQAPASAVLVFSRADIIDEHGRVKFESPDRISSPSAWPFKRLAKVLWSSSSGHSLWGLIRSDALRRTRLVGCIEADHVLLAELALLGELIEIPEVLYRQRRHPGCAIPTCRTAGELLAWHDPTRANARILLPHWERVYIEYVRGIRHTPLSASDRLLCFCTVPSVCYWSRFLRWSGPFRHRYGLHRKGLRRLYLSLNEWIAKHLPAPLGLLPSTRRYGMHVHALTHLGARRRQSFGTFFLRNRPELELMRSLLDRASDGSGLTISVLACSKGAEVYSIVWTIRSARPDLKLRMHAVDISRDVLEFAARGAYSLNGPEVSSATHEAVPERRDVSWNTWRDQKASLFERMSEREMEAMFDREGDQVKVKSWLKQGILWHVGDAGDAELVTVLGPQDMVVANRFLCHMEPAAAEQCLRNVARLVKPGGYLFVSGVDLDVRARVAREMGWKPVTHLMREIHEGDVSLRRDWPLEYWGLEPFQANRPDCMIRYASVFQLGEPSFFGVIADA